MVRDTARSYATDALMPRVTSAFLDERFDREIMREMGSLGLLGATIAPEYGGAGVNYGSYGLNAREGERVDSGDRSACAVQGALVMQDRKGERLNASHECAARWPAFARKKKLDSTRHAA